MRTIHFLINALSPNAGTIEKSVLRHFEPDKNGIVFKYSSYRKHAIELTLASVSEGAQIIVACGGDGTVNEVAQCLVDTTVIMGILPIGSGNGLARHLGIPRTLSGSLKTLSGFQSKRIDVGKVNDYYFFCNVGVAFSAQMIHCYDEIPQRGFLAYTRAFLRAVSSFKYSSFELREGNKTMRTTPFLLLLSNTDQLGYNKTLTPDASLFDGKLDLVQIERSNPFLLSFFLFFAFFKKFPPLTRMNRIQLEEIWLSHDNSPLKIQLDGEKLESVNGSLHVRVLPKSLEVICP